MNTFLNKFNEPFYFGIGGIGDCLLLLSSFYETIRPDEKVNFVFWANDKPTIESFLLAFDLDKKLNHKVVFQGWQTKQQFEQIVSHPLFKGKAHIPDNLDYVAEWSQNWKKYRDLIPEKFEFLKRHTYKLDTPYKCVGISPWGSRADAWKQKHLTVDELNKLIKGILLADPMHQVILFGGEKDKEHILDLEEFEFWRVVDLRGRSFRDILGYTGLCQDYITIDSFFKYVALWNDVPVTMILSRYLKPLKEVFGIDEDPADNIFVKNYGFNIMPIDLLLEDVYQNLDRKLVKTLVETIK